MGKKIIVGVVVVISLTTIFCAMCNSSSKDDTTATVYSYPDGTELYVVYDDGRVLDSRTGATGIWNVFFVMIGNNRLTCKTIEFNGNEVGAICTYNDKIYWGPLWIRDLKATYPNGGQQLKSRRR